ncbi:MAG TPA: tetratricopeptide repeat protein [Planctomycetota bacterium]|nr:tetratricopeptide repeat protein [Planctomycetota bacterium]
MSARARGLEAETPPAPLHPAGSAPWTAAADRPGSGARLERLQALLLIAPAALCAVPGRFGPLSGDPSPEIAGAGIALFAALGSGALLVARRAVPRPRGFALLAVFAAAGVLSLGLRPPSDTLEAARASCVALAALLFVLGGASLGESGRRTLARGLTVLALGLIAPAILDRESAFTGALGNTGATSEAALPGALAGAWLFATAPASGWGIAGATAAVLHATYGGIAPVLAGVLASILVLAAGCALGPRRAALAALLALVAGAALAGRMGSAALHGDTGEPSAAPAPLEGHLGGLEVRRRIASASLAMLADHRPLGTGPGQFAAAFPPYRDPAEMEASSPLRGVGGALSEVEHAHDDWLQGLLDTGLIGGAAWIAFLGLALFCALRRLRDVEPARAALAAAALGILVNALARAPLLWNPAAFPIGFAALGAVLAREPAGPRSRAVRILPAAMLLAAAPLAPTAISLVRHGAALSEALQESSAAALERALAARPDSVPALSALARASEGEDPRRALELWRRVLALRPHRIEALIQAGVGHARLGEYAPARAALEHAHALDPESGAVLRNLATLELDHGEIERAERWIGESGLQVEESLTAAGLARLELGRIDRGLAILARADPSFAGRSAQAIYERSKALEPTDEPASRALEAAAHVLWAREHAEQGNAELAVRSYRQARRCLASEASPRGPPPLRLETAAALALAGDLERAREELAGLEPGEADLAALPAWAERALRAAGLTAGH